MPESTRVPRATAHASDQSDPASTAPVPPFGSASTAEFLLRTQVLSADDLRRAHTRIAHEIVERNHGAEQLVLVGLHSRGPAIAQRLAVAIESFEGVSIPVLSLIHISEPTRRTPI